jgi:long-subunit acyl-CoA synthetase (AMP-forming)
MPEKTAEAINADGWLQTGDIAQIDDDGYVKIMYRKKDLIVNAAGQAIVPANIEGALRLSGPLIGQAIAIGDKRPYTTALIVLDQDAVPGFAEAAGIEDLSPAALAVHASVLAEVERCVAAVNGRLTEVEQIKRYTVLPTYWRPGGEELTPTMKLKREPISNKYAAEIEALYA